MRHLRLAVVLLLGLTLSVSLRHAIAQTATGSILGTVKDQSGAVLPGVKITIRSAATGTTRTVTSTESGVYSAIALVPGNYTLSFEASGFGKGALNVAVAVGVTTNADYVMPLASQETKVVVSESAVAVNTAQAVVEDVLNTEQIDELPLNGRNFLDLAQLNTGAQMQDGGNLDPTKQGFAGISLQGRSGRSTRIEVDGVDVSDDTVGTTTINLSEESVQEFQVAQSTLDPANSVTTSGAVNVITRAGSNDVHGSGFYLFRNNAMAARINGIDAPFDRSQVGFRVGGPVRKNRVFWFANYEHTLQHGTTFAQAGAPFSQFGGAFSSPFHESLATGRLDWNVSSNWRAFYAFHFDQMNLITGYGGIGFQPFANRNYNATNTFALDGTTGRFTHSFRVGLLRYRNYIADARSQVAGLPQPFSGGEQAGIAIGSGNDPLCTLGLNLICLGPNFLVAQTTLQHNQELRYDGSLPVRNRHTLRYGGEFVHVPEFGFAGFFQDGPMLNALSGPANVTNTFPGGASNPLNYKLSSVVFGNGLGFSSEKPALGFPHGGFVGNRIGLYIADFWKARPNLTVTVALRYNRVTGRTDSDARGLPALEGLIPGASHAPNQPNLSFAPQLGVAWDPFKDGRTSVRAGVGMFWDNYLIENLIFDRPLRIPGGLANLTPQINGGVVPGTNIDITPLIGQPIGAVVDQVVAAQAAYQAANQVAAQNFNPNGIPGFNDPNVFDLNTLFGVLAPNLKLPRSISMNFGVQRQVKPSLFISVDYLRNVTTHSLMNYDVNQVGAANSLNVTAAQAAIGATVGQFGCQGAASPIDCAIANGATIQDFAGNGLGSPANGLLTTIAPPGSGFAFAGRDPNLGQIMISNGIGRSVYNALQVRVKQDVKNPFPGTRMLSWQVGYNLSRFNSTEPDQDVVFAQNAHDNLNPLHYFGPNALDRTHMFTFASTFNFVGGLQVSMIARVYSALPQTLTIPLQCSCPAEVFLTDLTGDGTGGDVLPGTNVGSFGRSVKVGSLNNLIGNFNSNSAGQLTPASQALVTAGLFSSSQLQQLGAVVPSLAKAPAGQVGLDNFVADDVRLSYAFRLSHLWHRFSESAELVPTVDLYNVANKANFDPPGGFITSPLRGTLDGSVGSANGTTASQRINRYGLGSGVFSQGVPRALEVGMRLNF
ncbi:MAG TPA: TonB-dependent receptor [Terriglobales bacterium]|nr:TonB-dependent receptor [Terriglobales bacterium]